MTLAEFRRVYPTAAFTVSSGKLFTYRYYQNPQAKATLVLLTGGIGLSDLFYKHFARFARDFSVLTFDYQLQFGDNGEFADDRFAKMSRRYEDEQKELAEKIKKCYKNTRHGAGHRTRRHYGLTQCLHWRSGHSTGMSH